MNLATPLHEQIAARLRERLSPTRLEVIDESALHAGHAGAKEGSSGTHLRVRIASPAFDGLSRVARHRLVYDAVHDFFATGVHAIAIEVV